MSKKRTTKNSNKDSAEISGKDGKNLAILPIRPIEMKEKRKFHANLPSIARNNGSILLLVGSTASGKTTIINNLLLSKFMWGGEPPAFENCYIFTPSIMMDESCRFLRENFECYSSFNDEILQGIMDKQEAFSKKDRPKIMIVIDDSVGMIHSNSTLTHFLSRYRHWNANVIMSVQHFRSISPIGRANATDVCLMNGIINQKEVDKIDEEWGGMYRNTLVPMYRKYASKQYSFLYLKLRKNPAEMYQNFQRKINWKSIVKKYNKNYDSNDDVGEDELE